ncbi:MAG: hypothetical protein ACE5EO_09900 [Candidatus Krumholzibacteriia bacterium]
MHIDSDGYLLFQLDGDDERTARYDVFTSGGEFVNTATLPRLKRTAILSNGVIYSIELYDEESLVVYRYRRS